MFYWYKYQNKYLLKSKGLFVEWSMRWKLVQCAYVSKQQYETS